MAAVERPDLKITEPPWGDLSRRHLLLLAGYAAGGAVLADGAGTLSPAHLSPYLAADDRPDPRTAASRWFRQAHFGLFVHYSRRSIPTGAQGKPEFRPTAFSGRDLVQLARDAGMAYINFTPYHGGGAKLKTLPVEICTTMQVRPDSGDNREIWFDNPAARHRSGDEVWALIGDAAAQGANLLLNIGLRQDGSVHPADRDALQAVGTRLRNTGWPAPPP